MPLRFFLGVALGLLTLLLLYVTNVRLGMSSGMENICSLFSRARYFHRAELGPAQTRRLIVYSGCIVGGLLSALLGETLGRIGRHDGAVQ